MIRRMLIASVFGLSLYAGTSEACFGSYTSKAAKVPVTFRLDVAAKDVVQLLSRCETRQG